MNKTVIITNLGNDEKIRVTVHHDDSIKLIKLLADVGFIDYSFNEESYDTNDYSC